VKRLGIVRDAEKGTATSAFKSIQAALSSVNLSVPSHMNRLEGVPLGVSIFVLPNCQDSGMLEDLCTQAIIESELGRTDAIVPCVDEFFACLDQRRRKPANPAKARFAAIALGKDVIDPQLGRAAQQGAIPWNAKPFEQLARFLRSIARCP
jgi:hypothetical protein